MKALTYPLIPALLLWGALTQAQTVAVDKSSQHSVNIKTTTNAVYTLAGNPAPNVRDFVGRYLPGTVDWRGFLDWAYMNDGRDVAHRPAKPMADGKVHFVVAKPGEYEIRWYSLTDSGVAKLIRSMALTAALTRLDFAGPTMEVIHATTNDPDYIRIEITGQTGFIMAPKDAVVTVSPTTPLLAGRDGP